MSFHLHKLCQHGVNIPFRRFYTIKNTVKPCLHSYILYTYELQWTYRVFIISYIPDFVIRNQASVLFDQAFLLDFGITAGIAGSNPAGGIEICFV
jgi:hypothetical protein